jgi:fumarate reductase subunit D
LFGILPIGQLVLAALLILPLWKGVHHIRSLLIDLGGAERDGLFGSLLYLIALAGSVMALIAVVGL